MGQQLREGIDGAMDHAQVFIAGEFCATSKVLRRMKWVTTYRLRSMKVTGHSFQAAEPRPDKQNNFNKALRHWTLLPWASLIYWLSFRVGQFSQIVKSSYSKILCDHRKEKWASNSTPPSELSIQCSLRDSHTHCLWEFQTWIVLRSTENRERRGTYLTV